MSEPIPGQSQSLALPIPVAWLKLNPNNGKFPGLLGGREEKQKIQISSQVPIFGIEMEPLLGRKTKNLIKEMENKGITFMGLWEWEYFRSKP